MLTLSVQFEAALIYAAQIHAGQMRKKTGMPYLAHLLGVAGIVLEHGGNEIEAIAALLHDAVEDAGGAKRLEDIRERFGGEVAEIVAGCSGPDDRPRPPWRERKAAYLAHLPQAAAPIRLVLAADKLHNARALLRTYRAVGDSIWERYSGGKEGTLWYYRALVQVFQTGATAALAHELDQVVSALESLARTARP